MNLPQNKLIKGIALLATLLILPACDKTPPPVPQTTPDPLFKPQREALDKAKGVEQTGAKSAEELKQETEKQTQ